MWSHYADSHKGFCLEFTDYSDKELKEFKEKGLYPKKSNNELAIVRNAKKVIYKSTKEIDEFVKEIPTTVSEFQDQYKFLKTKKEKSDLLEKVKSASYVKHKNWSYENEYRMINIERNRIRFPGNLTSIYFGMNMPSTQKRMLGMTLNPNFNNSINIYQVFRPKNKYSLQARFFDHKKDLIDFDNELIY